MNDQTTGTQFAHNNDHAEATETVQPVVGADFAKQASPAGKLEALEGDASDRNFEMGNVLMWSLKKADCTGNLIAFVQ